MASDANKVWRIVARRGRRRRRRLTVRLVAQIDRFVDGGGLWLELTTESGPMTVDDVRWSVSAPRPQRPTAVVICTYNRVDDCLNTLSRAWRTTPALAEVVESVVVVDQGNDPLESAPVRGGRERLGARLRYVRQPNLGGAGGFTRGLFEATAGDPADDRDVLLMDDDVLLEPEILIRLTAFATCTTHPTIVGGQMLNLLHPAHLHICAEHAEPELLRVGARCRTRSRRPTCSGTDERAAADRAGPPRRHRVQRLVGVPGPGRRSSGRSATRCRCSSSGTTSSSATAPAPTASRRWRCPAPASGTPTSGGRTGTSGTATSTCATASSPRRCTRGFSDARILRRLGTLLSQYLVAMHYGLAATLIKAVEDFLERA